MKPLYWWALAHGWAIGTLIGLILIATNPNPLFGQFNPPAQLSAMPTSSASYTGPCDIVTCAEAYSVTRAMTKNYSGALFQLALASNAATTIDIGQTGSHLADMTTWSSFCSGSVSNCVFRKIYAQIQGHSNDLEPPTFNGGGASCGGGTAIKCAAPFAIEGATSLPIVQTNHSPQSMYIIGPATDAAATGITGGTGAISVLMNFAVNDVAKCCGQFGVAHLFNGGNTAGTDFLPEQSYDNSVSGFCALNFEHCLGLDLEGLSGGPGAEASPLATNDSGVLLTTFAGTGTNVFNEYYNGLVVSTVSPAGQNTCNGANSCRVRIGAGGDLSTNNDDVNFREGLITNTNMSSADQLSVLTNTTGSAAYSGLTYKTQNTGPYVQVTSGTAGSSNSNTAVLTIDTTGANFGVCAASTFTGTEVGTGSIGTDSKGNSWTGLTRTVNTDVSAQATIQIFYSALSSVGAGTVITYTSTTGFPSIVCEFFSGRTASSPFDNQNQSSTIAGKTPGQLTPGFFKELQVTAFGFNVAATPTISDSTQSIQSWSSPLYIPNTSNMSLAMSYTIQTAGVSTNPTWADTQNGVSSIAGFKP